MNKFKLLLGGSVTAIIAMGFMANSINGKQAERKELTTSPVVKAEGIESKNEVWAKYFPRQYDSWKQTRKNDKIDDMLAKKPQLAGCGLAMDLQKITMLPGDIFMRCKVILIHCAQGLRLDLLQDRCPQPVGHVNHLMYPE